MAALTPFPYGRMIKVNLQQNLKGKKKLHIFSFPLPQNKAGESYIIYVLCVYVYSRNCLNPHIY